MSCWELTMRFVNNYPLGTPLSEAGRGYDEYTVFSDMLCFVIVLILSAFHWSCMGYFSHGWF